MGQRHFDVQLMGGAALHFGQIAEMRTGEGKTLTSTLPSYLNAISGNRQPNDGLGTGHHSRCPGGATQPAPDKSNPRIEDPSLCNPKHDVGG